MCKQTLGVIFLCLVGLLAYMSHTPTPKDDPVIISCGTIGFEDPICKEGVTLWEKKTGKKAKVVPSPNGSTERYLLLQKNALSQANHIDIYLVDVIWPGLFADHFEDMRAHVPQEEIQEHFPQLIEGNTVDGRLVAIPWYVETGLLFYRKDLLKKHNQPIPETWDELERISKTIIQAELKNRHQYWGFIFQGRQAEILTCNALEWINSGPKENTIVDKNGHIVINTPSVIQSLERAARWVGTITPKSVLAYGQEDARLLFQSGTVIFMRNWPYAWTVLNTSKSPIKGKVGIAPLPKNTKRGRHAGTLGGWSLGISKYSKRKKDAASLIRFLTAYKEQKRRCLTAGYFPTLKTLYKDPEILNSAPFIGVATRLTLKTPSLRPARQTKKQYEKVSRAFWTEVHKVLTKKQSAATAIQRLEKQLQFLKKNTS